MAPFLSHFRARFSIFNDRQVQRNAQVMMRYLGVLLVLTFIYTELFQLLMWIEGQEHSWVTGLYWVLITMSTVGFGDVVFTSDLGRIFTMVVLSSGVILLLVVLPFVFVRLGPWLEARLRMKAPIKASHDMKDHIILCAYDPIAPGLIRQLEQEKIPYLLLETDASLAADRYVHGLSVIHGDIEAQETYTAARVAHARMVFANTIDTVNTNITLTVREVAPDVPIVAVAHQEHSIDVLELSGATKVLPLKRWLGEQLANRVNAVHAQLHPVGQYEDVLLAELPMHRTPMVGRTIRETRLRENMGVSIVSIWERGRLLPARSDLTLGEQHVAIIAGTAAQLEKLNEMLIIYDYNPNPVLVIGGGMVGSAAIRALHKKEVPTHLIEQKPTAAAQFKGICEAVFVGNAADYTLIQQAGIAEAPSVLLTTNDDAMNIYLASYCRHLNPDIRIVSRVTHERNVESLYRAGADFVLSYHSFGVDVILSILKSKALIVFGEGVDLFALPLPRSLHGKTLAQSGIGAKTGLNVIALRRDGKVVTSPSPKTRLLKGAEMLVIGDDRQRAQFDELFG